MAEPISSLKADAGFIERIFHGLSQSRRWFRREIWHDDPSESILIRTLRSLAQLIARTSCCFGPVR